MTHSDYYDRVFCPPLQVEVSIDPLTGIVHAPEDLTEAELIILCKWVREQRDKLERENA